MRRSGVVTATRTYDFSYGHRVTNHESSCAHLHGHNGRIHFTVAASELDDVGRVLDFKAIKDRLCQWVEINWDHKFLTWQDDPVIKSMVYHNRLYPEAFDVWQRSIVWLPCNPTAENLANLLLHTIGPGQLQDTDCTLVKVVFEETRKCKVEVCLDTFE